MVVERVPLKICYTCPVLHCGRGCSDASGVGKLQKQKDSLETRAVRFRSWVNNAAINGFPL